MTYMPKLINSTEVLILGNWYEVGVVKRATECMKTKLEIRHFYMHFTGRSLLLKNHDSDLRIRQ